MIDTKIKLLNSGALRQKAEQISFFDQSLKDLIEILNTVMYREKGLGVAANQIGQIKAVCVIDISPERNSPRAFVNPKILNSSDLILYEEGCLSIPGVTEITKRYNAITVTYQDVDGNSKTEDLSGIEAIAMQHEVDHLEGKLYIDQLSVGKRLLAVKRHKQFMNNGFLGRKK